MKYKNLNIKHKKVSQKLKYELQKVTFIFQMHFHTDYVSLYKFVNQASLPKDYGGDAQSMDEQNAFWIKMIVEQR